MPSLKSMSCHIQWTDTNTPFQEYGTFYGDGVVETFIVVPTKPQTFVIRVTSKGFIYEGLSVIVFVDGNYQCNRNRVNLMPPRKDVARERTEIDFLLRQKEKPISEGTYMGRQWRFDDHNIVAELPQGVKDSHFDMLGTIEVLVLRCSAKNENETNASTPSSGTESDIFNNRDGTAEQDNDDASDGKVDRMKLLATNGGEDGFALEGLFDGTNDYPPGAEHGSRGPPLGKWEWAWQPDGSRTHGPEHRGSAPEPGDTTWPPYADGRQHHFQNFGPPNHLLRETPSGEHDRDRFEKRVHFDYGPPRDSAVSRDDRYSDRFEDTQGVPPLSRDPRYRSVPGLSDWEECSQQTYDFRRRHDDYPTQHSQHYMYDGDNGRYSNYPPQQHYQQRTPPPLPPQPPAFPPHPPQMPRTHFPTAPCWVPSQARPTWMPPQTYHGAAPIPGVMPVFPPPFFAQGPGHLVGAVLPPPGFATPGLNRYGPTTGHVPNAQTPGGLDPARDDSNRENGGGPNQGDSIQNQYNDVADGTGANTNDNSVNLGVDQGVVGSWNDNSNNNDVANPQTNDDWITKPHESSADNWGAVPAENTGTQDTDKDGGGWGNDTSNNTLGTAATSLGLRQLYGPHGAYYSLKSSAPEEAPADAEEEPRYDIPQSIVDSKKSSKQVQAGKGYLYTKKRCCPEYLDNFEEPYARFVFKYRTKEQLKDEVGVDIETEPTGDEEVQTLQNMDKNELIEMLLRAKGALGGKIPEPPPLLASPLSQTLFEPVPVDPPRQEFLKYTLPPLRNTTNRNGSGLGISGGNAGDHGWGGLADNNQNDRNDTDGWIGGSNHGVSGWDDPPANASKPIKPVDWSAPAQNNKRAAAGSWDGAQDRGNTDQPTKNRAKPPQQQEQQQPQQPPSTSNRDPNFNMPQPQSQAHAFDQPRNSTFGRIGLQANRPPENPPPPPASSPSDKGDDPFALPSRTNNAPAQGMGGNDGNGGQGEGGAPRGGW